MAAPEGKPEPPSATTRRSPSKEVIHVRSRGADVTGRADPADGAPRDGRPGARRVSNPSPGAAARAREAEARAGEAEALTEEIARLRTAQETAAQDLAAARAALATRTEKLAACDHELAEWKDRFERPSFLRQHRSWVDLGSHGVPVPRILAIGERPEDIRLEGLPDEFVVKSGGGTSSKAVIPLRRRVTRTRYVSETGRDLRKVALWQETHPDIAVPSGLKDMVEIARRISLALPMPLCRVDLNETGSGPVLGEITRTPGVPHQYRADHDEFMGREWLKAEARLFEDLRHGRPGRPVWGDLASLDLIGGLPPFA